MKKEDFYSAKLFGSLDTATGNTSYYLLLWVEFCPLLHSTEIPQEMSLCLPKQYDNQETNIGPRMGIIEDKITILREF